MFKAYLRGGDVFSSEPQAFTLNEKSYFGEKKSGRVYFSSFESLYLVKRGKMEIVRIKKGVTYEELLSIFRRKDKDFELKFAVYEDLRSRGYVVKSALKFGADFRVYEKGAKVSKAHSRWLVFVTSEGERLKWQEFVARNRVAHSTKKKLLIAIVDEEREVSYFEVSWLRP
ncbi:tRNA-intron lyase [Candidatus Pacearchaeota archaeon]|nr:MAG: tRNA-intron lyase [Candidatus Pacearchaeota archaeon]